MGHQELSDILIVDMLSPIVQSIPNLNIEFAVTEQYGGNPYIFRYLTSVSVLGPTAYYFTTVPTSFIYELN
jgi:hypothetical protein